MSLERRGLNLPSARGFDSAGRQTGRAILYLSNGMEVRGTLILPSGQRLLDLLNLPAGPFISVTNAVVISTSGTRSYESFVVHKEHILGASELSEEATNP